MKRRGKRCKNPVLREIYCTRFKDLKNRYKAEILRAKQEPRKKFCMDNAKSSPLKIYKMFKAGFPRQPVPTSLTLPDGSVSKSAKETANALLHKFFPDNLIAQDSTQHKNIRVQVSGTEPPASQAEPNFKYHEVDKIVSNLQDKKCPVPDGIIIKRMHKSLPTFWTTLLNKCLLLECFPKYGKGLG